MPIRYQPNVRKDPASWWTGRGTMMLVLVSAALGLWASFLVSIKHDRGHLIDEDRCASRLDHWLYSGVWIEQSVSQQWAGLRRAMGDCLQERREEHAL